MPANQPPSGTVALLFTDVEGSTRLWEAHPEAMGAALRRHDALMREACAAHGGYVFKTIGDAFCVAFTNAREALKAVLDAQSQLYTEIWPEPISIRVRSAIHAGTVEARDDDYFGPPLNRVARLVAAGHGGQILLSQAAHELVRDELPPGVTTLALGEHRLKDLTRPEPVFQVVAPGLPEAFPAIRSLSSQPNNLPLQTTSFIGRERELAAAQEFLANSRLLTLTGAGGTGKTRLSLQVAAEALNRFPDGVWFVELAALSDSRQVPAAVAEALGLADSSHPDLVKRLGEEIGDRSLLILLDNCEHVIDAAARLCEHLLRVCPGLRLLTSSREPLRVPGEQTFRVPPLAMPEPQIRQTEHSVSQYEAVRLFIDRALLHNPSFRVTNENAPDLAMLCAQLDGIPLALELAAARVRSLPVGEIAKRLDQRFQMLTSGVRTALPRQQTLRALVDWSYELLTPAEKVFLARMSVFAGGFDHERAERVGTGEPVEDWECLDVLSSLVDKSLILVEENADGPRYRLQETIRQYGEQRLEDAEVRRHLHLRAFADRAHEARPHLHSPQQKTWVQRIQCDAENFRAALRWGFGPSGDSGEAIRLAASLGRYWYIVGAFTEGTETLTRAMEFSTSETPGRDLGAMLNSLGLFAFHRAEYAVSRGHFMAASEYQDTFGETSDRARLRVNLGNIAFMLGDFSDAQSQYTQALESYRTLKDESGIGLCLNNLACALTRLGNLEEADRLAHQGLEARRRVGDPWNTAYSLMCLADIAEQQGDLDRWGGWATEAWQLRHEIGDQSGLADTALCLARWARSKGDAETRLYWLREARAALRSADDRRSLLMLILAGADAFRSHNPKEAARLLGAFIALNKQGEAPVDATEEAYIPELVELLLPDHQAAFDAKIELADAVEALDRLLG